MNRRQFLTTSAAATAVTARRADPPRRPGQGRVEAAPGRHRRTHLRVPPQLGPAAGRAGVADHAQRRRRFAGAGLHHPPGRREEGDRHHLRLRPGGEVRPLVRQGVARRRARDRHPQGGLRRVHLPVEHLDPDDEAGEDDPHGETSSGRRAGRRRSSTSRGRTRRTRRRRSPRPTTRRTSASCRTAGSSSATGTGRTTCSTTTRTGNSVKVFGGTGEKLGKFRTPHGQWVDDRKREAPVLVVCDRANARLQTFTLDGKPIMATDAEGGRCSSRPTPRPGATWCCFPDLHARVSLFDADDRNYKPIVHLGEDKEWREKVVGSLGKKGVPPVRNQPKEWLAGQVRPPARRLLRQGRQHLTSSSGSPPGGSRSSRRSGRVRVGSQRRRRTAGVSRAVGLHQPAYAGRSTGIRRSARLVRFTG